MLTRLCVTSIALMVFLMAGTAAAHENRPLYVDIVEEVEGNYSVNMKVPPTVPLNNQPKVIMPGLCTQTSVQSYRCDEELSGQEVAVTFTLYNPSVSTFIRLTRSTGEVSSELLTAEESKWLVPSKETATSVAKHYTWLGVEHILIGLDHLLFLGCLLLVAKSLRRVVITITGFTLAHSITLVAAALEWVKVPSAPVETLIAFSILFLAVEIARKELFNQADKTLTYQYPVLVSSSFGLLHGFGFASVLREIGLPQTEVVTGLLFFNVGVELGQILFSASCFAVIFIIHKTIGFTETRKRFLTVSSIYIIGVLSSFWLFDRGLSVFTG